MKEVKFVKIFLGTFVLTITAFAFASYSYKRAQIANPDAFSQITQHYNISVDSAGPSFSIISNSENDSPFEETENTWNYKEPATAITISTKAGDVAILPSNDNQFHIKAIGELGTKNSKELFDVDLQNSEIFISDESIATRNVKLTIEVPKSSLKVIRVSSISGNLSLENFAADELHTITVSGNLTYTNTAAKYIEAKSTSGNILINNKLAATMDTQSVSGKVLVSGPEIENSNFAIFTTSGKITNPFAGNKSADAQIKISTTSGDIEITSSKSQ